MSAAILDQIVEKKRERLARSKQEEPLSSLEERAKDTPLPLNFSGALRGPGVRLIAETKKASPSRGLLHQNYDPVSLARIYAENGAAAVSVLTEIDYFQGSLEHLEAVKDSVRQAGLPVLRKDFIFDPYQVLEARASGADAILLIVAMLDTPRIKELLGVAQSLSIQALVEVHSEHDLDLALEAGAEIIGINHRDLKTFQTDVTLSQRLRPLIPEGKVVVAESGIGSREDVIRLKESRVDAVLVGEALVTASDVAAKVRELAHP